MQINFSPSINPLIKNAPLKTISFKGQEGDVFVKSSAFDYEKEIAQAYKKISELENKTRFHNYNYFNHNQIVKNQIQQLNEYIKLLKAKDPKAFLHKPNSSLYEMKRTGKQFGIYEAVDFSKQFGCQKQQIVLWNKAGKLDVDYVKGNGGTFIDTNNKKNKEFLASCEKSKKTSVPMIAFANKLNVSKSDLLSAVQSGEILILGLDEGIDCEKADVGFDSLQSILIDLKNPVNERFARDYSKCHPLRSKYFYAGNSTGKPYYVPVSHLVENGYGSFETFSKLIETGYLQSKKGQKENGEDEYYINLGEWGIQDYLMKLKANNPEIISVSDFCKQSGIEKDEILQKIKEGNLKITRYILFHEERNQIYLDLRDEETKEFVSGNIKKTNSKQTPDIQDSMAQDEQDSFKNPLLSLKLKIVWNMCPRTKAVMSSLAKENGYLSVIFKKIDNNEKLSKKEDIVYKTYLKRAWQTAGKDEYKEAMIRAEEILDTYFDKGLDYVEDDEIKKIIIEFYENLV